MNTWHSYPAPAKLNLFLHITGRLPNGYHTLQTIFQFITLQDTIEICPRQDRNLTLQAPQVDIAVEKNLVMRAALALQQASGCTMGADIRLHKRIPAGGGLGGGSSDAATTLLALNRLWGLQWSLSQLASLGIKLGADVAVFIHGQAAWAEGIGEQLTPLSNLPEPWYLVVHPGCQVPTSAMYQAWELTRDTPFVTIRDFLAGRCHNDFEPVVRIHYPPVAQALHALQDFAPAYISGSGGCVFASFVNEQTALHAQAKLATDWQCWVVQGCNQSPMRAWMIDQV